MGRRVSTSGSESGRIKGEISTTLLLLGTITKMSWGGAKQLKTFLLLVVRVHHRNCFPLHRQ